MGWQNVIIGFEVKKFEKTDKIPPDAIFLYQKEEFVGMFGWIHDLKPHYKDVLFYQVPIYKKKNIKIINNGK